MHHKYTYSSQKNKRDFSETFTSVHYSKLLSLASCSTRNLLTLKLQTQSMLYTKSKKSSKQYQ